jgi:protein involved in polysaccharide export with SLBB domain
MPRFSLIISQKFLSRLMVTLALVTGSAGLVYAQDGGNTSLRPGDALRLTVWRNAEMSGDFNVLVDGSIAHPLLRDVKVVGTPMSAVEASIRTFLKQYEAEPRFVLQPLYRITVSGEVRTPGVYPLPPSATIAEALATAGGLTDRAKLDAVRLHREGAVMLVDLTDASPQGLGNSTIRSGDQLYVERRTSFFRDILAPAGSVIAALAAITNIFVN